MKGFLFFSSLLAATILASTDAECSLSCDDGITCYATAQAALDCLESVPFNEEWAYATLDVLSQSLENFGFGALYHSTGPPYSIQLDVLNELSATGTMVAEGKFSTDLDFQEHVQSILQRTIDAHTRYHKPACYNAVFVQPFAFDMRVVEADGGAESIDNEPQAFTMRNLYTEQYAQLFPEVDVEALFRDDRKIELIDGLELTTAVAAWGDTHETRSNNPGIRFNAAIRSYLYRSALDVNILLPSVSEALSVTFNDGSVISLPWMASYSAGLADVNVCAAPSSDSQLSTEKTSRESKESLKARHGSGRAARPSNPAQHPSLLDPPQRLQKEPLLAERADREVIIDSDSEYFVSCFVQNVDSEAHPETANADVSRVLVMKVASFSPSAETYIDAWQGFLGEAQQCLSAEFDMVVVDVMQNGGGYVCLGIRLIELLVEEYYNDHTAVQMHYDLPHSPLMDRYIDVVNYPDPYPDPDAVEQILDRETQEPFPDGRAYYYPGRNVTMGGVQSWRTNWFSLDCREAEAMPSDGWVPPRFMPPEKLIILSDGTCGSTCASFTRIPQEAGKATFVGAGGLWDQEMDVASFAGGFVCNPDYLQNIADWSNTTFPSFATNQRWQFGWAAWYSAKLPSRPVQFTTQEPDYRQPFWGFPHVSIDSAVTTAMVSGLYDRVIHSSLVRLSQAATQNV